MDQIRILIADDNASDRLLLSKIIKKQGHDVIQAENGKQAIDLYSSEKPDIILMDVLMPEMNGKEATQAIKEIAGEELVPIIFLTSLADAQSLADCLDAGGDDFLTKPYNHIILKAKIDALVRMKKMHTTMQKQRDTIAENNQHMLHEQRVAKAVFDNVAHSGCLDASNIRYMLSPLAVFNGDVLLAARKPSGGMHIFLGDFTGHGLPAAIGAMPMAEIFYGMTAKGFALRDILREINLKLKSILPVGFFCCAAVVDLSFTKRNISVWMGGVPDCYLLTDGSKQLKEIRSSHLPLGVLGNEQFDDSMTEHSMEPGDRLFMWSDGIIEARNEQGDMFGEERLKGLFDNPDDSEAIFDAIKESVNTFVGEGERDDDTTLIEVRMVEDGELVQSQVEVSKGPVSKPIDWEMDFKLGIETLRHFNPLPLIMHVMMEVPALRAMGGQLYTVVAELYSNAFEHGVLKLDSSLKQNPQGFAEYYSLRERRLKELQEGEVIVRIQHIPNGEGQGILKLSLIDSGDGFDFHSKNREFNEANQGNFCGRGIPLISSLCHSLEYKGAGNEVEAEIHWPVKSS